MTGSTNVERELKLGVPSGFSLARLPANLKNYVASPAHFERLHTIYFDTTDFRLMRWGCSLRFRRGEGWTLKLPVLDGDGDAMMRTEHVFASGSDRVPDAALDLATPFLRGSPIRRVAELRTLRVKRDFLCDGALVAEVVEDDVRVVEGTRVSRRFAQLEIELAHDVDGDALDALASTLRDEGAGAPERAPKNAIAAQSDGAPEIEVPVVGPGATIGAVVRAALGAALVQYMRCEPQLRVTSDIEAVHKARVAVRKLRSHLRTFAPVLGASWARELRERLRFLQDGLAPVRDADVFAQHMRTLSECLPPNDMLDAQPLLHALDEERQNQRNALRTRLHDAQYVRLLDDLIAAVREPRFTIDERTTACDLLRPILRRVFKKVRKMVREAGRVPSDRALHRIRIKAKHLRYAAESFAAAIGGRAERYAKRVERLQELLGTQHDAVVALQRLRSAAGLTPSPFAAGELAMLATSGEADARGRWRSLWKPIAKKSNRFW